MSKLSGPVSDMIIPRDFELVEQVADPQFKLRRGIKSLKEGGMIKLTQKKSAYFQINTENSAPTESDDETKKLRNKRDHFHELSESMDEDEVDNSYEQLFDDKGNQKDFESPAIFNARKKKDKTLKCRKCCKGGHLDVHCPLQIEQKNACIICQS